MLLQASTYFLTPSKSKLVTIGIDLFKDEVQIEVRLHTNKRGIAIPNWSAFESKFSDIEDFFESPLDSGDLYFSLTDAGHTVYFAGRKRFKNKLLVIFTKELAHPTKIFLARNTFLALKDITQLITNRRTGLLQDFKCVKSVAEMLCQAVVAEDIRLDEPEAFRIGINSLNLDRIIRSQDLNMEQAKIVFEIAYFCPLVLLKMIKEGIIVS
jgi:hypothetical protein